MSFSGFDLRPGTSRDEARILELMSVALGDGMPRDPAFWRWKHVTNPAGPSWVRVAEDAEGLVGLRAMMRWRFRVGGREVLAARPVDTATHPRAQRRGLFSQMTRALLDELASDGVGLVFNTPNDQSRPGYAKLGWRPVGRLTVWVRPGGRFAVCPGAPRQPFSWNAEPVPHGEGARAHTVRDAQYLRWRYAEPLTLGYGLARDDDVAVVYRCRARFGRPELTVTDLVCARDVRSIARCARLLRQVVRGGTEVHALAMGARGTREAAVLALAGFVPAPGRGPLLMVREVPGGPPVPPALLQPAGWRVQVGDLEVF